MPIDFRIQDSDVIVLRVSGELKIDEFQDTQLQCEEIIKTIGRVKLLVITENFQGWERAEGWEDWSFAERNDPYIDKIAIVGDPKWKDLVFAFTAKGLRPVSIEYFDSDQETKAWQWLNAT